jgi:conjugal transfer/entry exclusion protein
VKRKQVVSIFGIVLVLASLVRPAFGILGIGDIVFDPSNYAQAVQQLLQLEQQYAQLVQTYQMIRSQYEQMVWMAKRVPVDMALRYRAVATPWRISSAANTYGTTGGWVSGINSGLGVTTGYSQATQALHTYGAALGNVPADQLERVKTDYATVELTDGANLHAMETIGRLRANAQAVEGAIQGLEDDSLSANPDMNTEIAVLNKINAANLVATRNIRDTNTLLVVLAEHEILDAKRKRDAEAQAINSHIRFMTEGKAVMSAQSAGASAAMRNWRMP